MNHRPPNPKENPMSENKMREAERVLKYALEAIDTGRSEPLFVARDTIRNYFEDTATPHDIQPVGEDVEQHDWFVRNADERNEEAFINANPRYFAEECAAAIRAGFLVRTRNDSGRGEEFGELLDDFAAHDHRQTADRLEGLRDRLGRDALSVDEWNALVGATSHHRLEARRREQHLPQPHPFTTTAQPATGEKQIAENANCSGQPVTGVSASEDVVEKVARACFAADIRDGKSDEELSRLASIDVTGKWYDEWASMPLSGPPHKRRWEAIASAALAASTPATCPFCTGQSRYSGNPKDVFCAEHFEQFKRTTDA
jgi:hypothetical protein